MTTGNSSPFDLWMVMMRTASMFSGRGTFFFVRFLIPVFKEGRERAIPVFFGQMHDFKEAAHVQFRVRVSFKNPEGAQGFLRQVVGRHQAGLVVERFDESLPFLRKSLRNRTPSGRFCCCVSQL